MFRMMAAMSNHMSLGRSEARHLAKEEGSGGVCSKEKQSVEENQGTDEK